MNLTDPTELRSLLQRHGLSPTKRWGQHFLISPRVVGQILQHALPAAGILEIGPGPGVLTRPLSEQCQRLIALEIDLIAISALSESAPKAEVRAADALAVDLEGVLGELPTPRVLVSNMPYNITGPLLDRFTKTRSEFDRAVLMMQREVGEKILAVAGDRTAGALSIVMQCLFEIHKLCDAPSGAFFPPPKVDSIVLHLIPRCDRTEYGESFSKFVHHGFRQPRKTLSNNLAGRVDRDRLASWLRSEGLSESIRPHQIGVDAWMRMFAELQSFG